MNETIIFAAAFFFALCSEIRFNTFSLLINAVIPAVIGTSFYFLVMLMPTMTAFEFVVYISGFLCGVTLGDIINKMLALDISELMK